MANAKKDHSLDGAWNKQIQAAVAKAQAKQSKKAAPKKKR